MRPATACSSGAMSPRRTSSRTPATLAALAGHILKDPGILLEYHRDTDPPPPGANRPIEIEPELQAIERVLAQASP